MKVKWIHQIYMLEKCIKIFLKKLYNEKDYDVSINDNFISNIIINWNNIQVNLKILQF